MHCMRFRDVIYTWKKLKCKRFFIPFVLSEKNVHKLSWWMKMKLCWKCIYPRAIPSVDGFCWCFVIIYSPMDPLQLMGAVRIRVQLIKMSQVIHTTSISPSINVLWSKKRFVINPCLRNVKHQSIIHNINTFL